MAAAIDIDEFKRYNVDLLRKYCRERGLAVAGRRKEELVALAFAASLQNLPIVCDKVSEKHAVDDDYEHLLILRDGTVIPNPLQLTDGWLNEKKGISCWPPCMILNMLDYLVFRDERPLLQRLQNEYNEGIDSTGSLLLQ
jgi:hypothetical protein